MKGRFSWKRLKALFKFRTKEPVEISNDILEVYLDYANDPWQILHMIMKNLPTFKENKNLPSYIYKDGVLFELNKINTETYTDTVDHKNDDMVKAILDEINNYTYSIHYEVLGYVNIGVEYSSKYIDEISNFNGAEVISSKYNEETDTYIKIFRFFYNDLLFIMRHNSRSEIGIKVINTVLQYIPTDFVKHVPDKDRLYELYDIKDITVEASYTIGNVFMPVCNIKISDNIILLSYDAIPSNNMIYLMCLDTLNIEEIGIMRSLSNKKYEDNSNIILVDVEYFMKNVYNKDLDIELCNKLYEAIISLNIYNNDSIYSDDNNIEFYEGIDEVID